MPRVALSKMTYNNRKYMELPQLLDIYNSTITGEKLIITGGLGSGKTTFVRELIKERSVCGIITRKYEDRFIGAVEIGNDSIITLGVFTSKGVDVNEEAFDGEMVDILDRCEKLDSTILVDEVGFIERKSSRYIDKLVEVFNGEKPVIFVVRKDRSPIWDNMERLINPQIFDLDDYNKGD